MKLTITMILLSLGLGACGSFEQSSPLEVQMYATATSPEGATGDRNPSFQSYELTQIEFLSESTATSFLTESETFKIVDRAQLLYDKDLSDLVGNTYTGVRITFAENVVGGDGDHSDLSFTLTEPVQTLTKAFTVEESKSLTFMIKVRWGNTLSDAAMTEPSFEITGP